MMCLVVAISIYNPDKLQMEAIPTMGGEWPFVTSNTPNANENYFVDQDSGFQTNLNLLNCTLFERFEIGLVRQDTKTGSTDGYDVLLAIYEELAEAYQTANLDTTGKSMSYKVFNTNDDLDEYVRAAHSKDFRICFAIGWDEFNVEENTFGIDLRWNFGTIWAPRLPQYEYEESSQYQLYLPEFALTGFYQTMTSVTNKILSEVYDKTDYNFQLMYLPMDSEPFYNDLYAEVLTAVFPAVIYVFINIVHRIMYVTGDPNEEKIQQQMQIMGMRKSAELFLEYTIQLIIQPGFMTILCLIGHAYIVPTMSYGFLLVNIIIYALNVTLQSHLIKFLIDSHLWAEVAEIFFEVLAISTTAIGLFMVKIVPPFTYWTSFALPLPHIAWVCKLGVIAYNKQQDVSLFQENVITNYNDLTVVMHMACYSFLVKLVIIMYAWPIKITNDTKGSRGLLYLFMPSFWRSVCCKKDQSAGDQNESGIQVDDIYQDVNRLSQGAPGLFGTQSIDSKLEQYLHMDERAMIEKDLYEVPLKIEEKSNVSSISESQKDAGDEKQILQLDRLHLVHNKHNILDHVSLTVFEGEIMAIIGENGSGKSALLDTIAGLSHVHSGTIKAFRVDLLKAVRFQTKNMIAYCTQTPVLIEDFSPRENMIMLCKFSGKEDYEDKINNLLSEFDLLRCADINVQRCSVDENRRLKLALSLFGESKVILLDEPTFSMSMTTKRRMWELIRKHKSNKCILIATQDMTEAEELGDRIAQLSHGKIKMCGSPKFFAKKLEHTINLKFSTLMNAKDKEESQQSNQDLRNRVKNAIIPEYKSQIQIGWNQMNQLVVKLPVEIDHDQVGQCVNMEELYSVQGKLYQSLHIGRTQLDETFGELIDLEENDPEQQLNQMLISNNRETVRGLTIRENDKEASVSDPFMPSDEQMEARQVSWWTATKALIITEFAWSALWRQMLKLLLLVTLLVGQETFLVSVFFVARHQKIIKYSSPQDEIFYKWCEIKAYANSLLPDGVTETTDFLELYSQNGGGIVIVEEPWVPETGASVSEVLKEYAHQIYTYGQDEAPHSTFDPKHDDDDTTRPPLQSSHSACKYASKAFGSYYIYELDTENDQYSIGIYGDQIAAASSASYGATMLNTVAQSISGEQTLSIAFNNKLLPVNNGFFPIEKPVIAELYGVSALVGIIYVLTKQAEWHGKPIESGYHLAYITKGGFKTSYLLTKFLKAILSNMLVISVLLTFITAEGFELQHTSILLFAWIFVCPWMIYAVSNIVTIQLRQSHTFSLQFVKLLSSFMGVFALIGAGSLAFGQENASQYDDLLYSISIFPPTIPFALIEYGMLYRLRVILEANRDDELSVELDPWSTFPSYIYVGIIALAVNFFFWLAFTLITLRDFKYVIQHKIKQAQPLDSMQVRARSEEVNEEALKVDEYMEDPQDDHVLLVNELQCIRMFKKNDYGLTSNTEDNVLNIGSNSMGVINVKGVSFSIKRKERFVILGPGNSGATPIIETILGHYKNLSGDFVVDGIKSEEILFQYHRLHGKVGYQPQQNAIDEDQTAQQHLFVFAKVAGIQKQDIEAEVECMIQACDLAELKDCKAGDMSHGQMRRLTLGMALIGRPKLVILDNPLDGVDPVNKRKLIQTISLYTENQALLLVTRDANLAEAIGHRIAIISQGKFLAIGSVTEILQRHGQGYTIDIKADMNQIAEQSPTFSWKDDTFIDGNADALEILSKIQGNLEEKEVQASCNLVNEFSSDGLLKNIFNQIQQSYPYPLHKFYNEILVMNLALITVEKIYGSFSLDEVSISSIHGDLIRLAVFNEVSFSVADFTQGFQEITETLAIAFFSVSSTSLDRVLAKLIQNESFDKEKIRSSVFIRAKTMKMKTSQRVNDSDEEGDEMVVDQLAATGPTGEQDDSSTLIQ